MKQIKLSKDQRPRPKADQPLAEKTKDQSVVYLGIPGSFTHVASENYFGSGATFLPAKTVSAVFSALADKQYGVVPLENSLHGNVVESFDLLARHHYFLVGEVYLRIHHCIVGKPQAGKDNFRGVTRCLSHWQAISQCEPFFDAHPWITPVFSGDTATAALEVAESGRPDTVAIAGRQAADRYHLAVLATDVEKSKKNYTRFGIIAKKKRERGDKITLAFSVKHIPGSLVSALTPYAAYGLNLMQIESRPKENSPWEYTFFLDLDIQGKEKILPEAITAMRKVTSELQILGQYPKGVMYES